MNKQRKEKKKLKRELLQLKRFEQRGGFEKMQAAMRAAFSQYERRNANAYHEGALFEKGIVSLISDFVGQSTHCPIIYFPGEEK